MASDEWVWINSMQGGEGAGRRGGGECEVSPPTPPPRTRLSCIAREPVPSFSRIAGGLKLAQTQAMAVAVGFMPEPPLDRLARRSPLLHRASFHGRGE